MQVATSRSRQCLTCWHSSHTPRTDVLRQTAGVRHRYRSTTAWHQEQAAPTQQQVHAAASVPNELLRIIETHIKTHGPLPLPRYIQLCLSHPTLGYYTRLQRQSQNKDEAGAGDDIIGKRGDFVTSPEISQVFGELLAIWFVHQWQQQGMPLRTRIVELGPGKGTLMDDMLRTFRSIKAFSSTLREVHLVETSPFLKERQRQKLEKHTLGGIDLRWHDRIQDIRILDSKETDTFTMIVANEFFDALPIHLFEKQQNGFREVFVDLDTSAGAPAGTNSGEPPKPKLRYVVSPAPTLASNLLAPADDPVLSKMSGGARVEVCAEAYEIAACAGALLGEKGAGLIVDYGDERIFGSSFRAFKSHRIVDPLEDPGSADLTSNVNFSFLREALSRPKLAKREVAGPPPAEAADTQESGKVSTLQATGEKDQPIFVAPLQSQRSFLLSLGLNLRVQKMLDQTSDAKRRENIIQSAQKLVEKNEKIHGMGKTFKVMGFVPSSIPAIADSQMSTPTLEQAADQEQQVFPFGLELD